MRLQAFHLSVQGASHLKKNKECQDAALSYADENCAIAIVCDGHGGSDYVRSADGSKLACAITRKNIKSFVQEISKAGRAQEIFNAHPENGIRTLQKKIIAQWNDAVLRHQKKNPFTEDEIAVLSERAKKRYAEKTELESFYGTTLIAVVCTPNFWFGMHIGDGKCVAVRQDGEFRRPIPWDERCFLNATTSLCDEDALARFRHIYSTKLPRAIFVGTDGVDDSFQNEEQLNQLYATVLYSFSNNDWEEAKKELKDYLLQLSKKGSGDDVSIAAILNMEAIADIPAVMKIAQKEKEARAEEGKEEGKVEESKDLEPCLEETQSIEAANTETASIESQIDESQVGEAQNGESLVDEAQTAEREAPNPPAEKGATE